MARIRGDLRKRTAVFALKIMAAVDALPQRTVGWELGKQLFRSGTSIGSNIHEADQAISDAEFAHKCSIARKEASETRYWLDLALRGQLLAGERIVQLATEAEELMRVLAAIVLKTQKYLQKQP